MSKPIKDRNIKIYQYEGKEFKSDRDWMNERDETED